MNTNECKERCALARRAGSSDRRAAMAAPAHARCASVQRRYSREFNVAHRPASVAAARCGDEFCLVGALPPPAGLAPAQPSAQAEAVAVACSSEERCIVVDPIDGSAVESKRQGKSRSRAGASR